MASWPSCLKIGVTFASSQSTGTWCSLRLRSKMMHNGSTIFSHMSSRSVDPRMSGPGDLFLFN